MTKTQSAFSEHNPIERAGYFAIPHGLRANELPIDLSNIIHVFASVATNSFPAHVEITQPTLKAVKAGQRLKNVCSRK